jgi:hypothetical protein
MKLLLLLLPTLAMAQDSGASSDDFFKALVTMLLAVSELLSFMPKVKSNGVFQLAFSFIKKLK